MPSPRPARRTPTQPGARRAAEVAHARGAETRRRILEAAVELGASEGLEPLTLGKLAEHLGISKAGLFGHFGSKEELQLATVDAAREIFIERVVRPALAGPAGVPRLAALCERKLEYSESFEGGCFFSAASSEFDDRPGPVRDRVAACMKEWLAAIERAVRDSQRCGHIPASVDPTQVAFELNALALAANWSRRLFADSKAASRSHAAMVEKVHAIATPEGRRQLAAGQRARR